MLKMHIEWMRAAHDDLVLLADILDNESITHLIAFHSQQAVEKSLKGYLKEFYDFAIIIFDRVCEMLNINKGELV